MRTPPAVLFALAVACGGCGPPARPHAPAVTREPVYEDAAAGLRFSTPTGWMAVSRASVPPGPLGKPQIAVSYMLPNGDRPTEFELVVADPVPVGGLEAFLTDTPIGLDWWKTKEPPGPTAVNGTPAERVVLTRGSKRGEVVREVTAFRRPDRTYLFFVTFDAADRSARDAAHRCVESVEWK